MQGEYTGLIQAPYPDGERLAKVRGDKRRMDYGGGTLHPLYLPLDAAQTPKEFNIPGDVIYVDKLSTGTIKIRLDTSWARGFPLGANAAMSGTPFKSFMLEWDAQPGLIATLWVGYGIEIVPPNQDITSIGSVGLVTLLSTLTSITNDVNVNLRGVQYASKYSSNTAFGAAAGGTVFTAASNTNGARIVQIKHWCINGGALNMDEMVVAHTVAPAAPTDGDILSLATVQLLQGGTWYECFGEMEMPKDIASGKGMFVYNSGGAAETGAHRGILYTLK